MPSRIMHNRYSHWTTNYPDHIASTRNKKKKNEISHRAAVTMTFVQHTNNKSVYIVLHG